MAGGEECIPAGKDDVPADEKGGSVLQDQRPGLIPAQSIALGVH